MFGMVSDCYYKAVSDKTAYVTLFRIEAETFMNTICKDSSVFRHMHRLSLQKLRFKQQVFKLNGKMKQRTDNQKVKGVS